MESEKRIGEKQNIIGQGERVREKKNLLMTRKTCDVA